MADGPPPIALPQPLSAWKVAALTTLLCLCVTAFLAAFAGLFVLTDPERKTWLGQTLFAEKYRQVIVWNQMTSGVCFNGGMLGTVLSFARLRKHRQAVLLKNVRFLKPEDIRKAQMPDKKKRK